jgi:photosystem II stability/assembly factor-like uncharacterized protein
MRNMPKSILVALLLLATTASAQQWKTVTFQTRDIVTGISFCHPDTGFVCTSAGTVARTMDAGQSWDLFNVRKGVLIEDIHFVNSQRGFAVGRKATLFGTSDGGYTWERLFEGDTSIWFSEVLMFTDKVGMVIGMTRQPDNPYEGIALRTTDGGASWGEIDIPGLGYGGLFAEDNGKVFMVSFGRLHQSSDLGKTWQSQPLETEKPIRTLSLYKKAGIMGGLGGVCAYSPDQGQHWNTFSLDPNMVLLAAEMISEKEGYLAGANGVMLRTLDGGLSFTADTLPKPANILDMQQVGDILYAVGSEGSIFYKTFK